MNDTPNKALGQHWLFDEPTLERIAELAELSSDDTVLEIGPGLGALTAVLCGQAARVVAVEADRELAEGLEARVTSDNLEVHEADILQFDLDRLPERYKVVANVPYYISSQILRQLWGGGSSPSIAVLLLQKEVAERVAAVPGSMSVLAFSVQYYARAEVHDTVPKELFEPPPKVDSAILRMQQRPSPYFAADEKQLFRLVKAGFGERRKKLTNALAGGLRIDKDAATALLKRAGISTDVRAQELEMDEWAALYQVWYDENIVSSK